MQTSMSFPNCTHINLTEAHFLCRFNKNLVFIVGKDTNNQTRLLTCPEEYIQIANTIEENDIVLEKFWEAYKNYHLYLSRSRRPYEVELDDGIREFFNQLSLL